MLKLLWTIVHYTPDNYVNNTSLQLLQKIPILVQIIKTRIYKLKWAFLLYFSKNYKLVYKYYFGIYKIGNFFGGYYLYIKLFINNRKQKIRKNENNKNL